MEDLVGNKYGELEVISFAFRRGSSYYWMCRCDCGVEKPIRSTSLKRGYTKTCGHIKDLTGQRFGRLTVESFSHMNRIQHWNCVCDCGNTCIVNINNLHSGTTRSCGCLQQESRTDHGLSKHPLNIVWRGARSRCNNKNSSNFKDYGGRGIFFCEEWNDFKVFYDWAIDNGYDIGLELDRIDNYGPYSPENCRWATRVEQCNNTRNNKFFTLGGETKSITQWAKIFGIPNSTVFMRIHRGESVERALRVEEYIFDE